MAEAFDDTIAAVATPPGRGGIGVVRISGSGVGSIARAMLGSVPKPRIATLSSFCNRLGEALDSGIALYFPAPASFTGESVLELHGHGGPFVQAMLVDAAVELGARRAEPGEFSKRAFLNGKLDLAQAEAIADLIDSGTAQAARAALRSLTGAFSERVNRLVEELTELRVYVEAAIDFPDEEVDFLSGGEIGRRLNRAADAFEALLDESRNGRILRDGFVVVLVGRPNAGKSSLMNLLSGEETAIVTEVAGTTRDVLRERIDIDGLAVELVDTAGLRDDPGRIEAEGIRRAKQAIERADAVLWVQDASDPDAAGHDEAIPPELPLSIVVNKIDVSGDEPGVSGDATPIIRLSARTGAGVDALREHLCELAGYSDQGDGAFTARRRHVDALAAARRHFERARRVLIDDLAGELMAEELRLAQRALGEITGAVSSDDLLGRIFESFCIGK